MSAGKSTGTKPETYPGLGKRVREAREALGIPQAKLAKLAGVSLNHVAVTERGKVGEPKVSTLESYARALQKTVDWLKWGDGQPMPPRIAESVVVNDRISHEYVAWLEQGEVSAEIRTGRYGDPATIFKMVHDFAAFRRGQSVADLDRFARGLIASETGKAVSAAPAIASPEPRPGRVRLQRGDPK